jgi:hypothetical protein
MASRFWVGGTGTWDAADTTHWASSSGGAGGQSVPGAAGNDTVTFDGSSGGGTVTVAADVSLGTGTITFGAFTGTIDFATNDNNVSCASVSGTGTGARTLNMGDGTWTISLANGNAWNFTTTTSLIFNANSSTILFSATATGQRTFAGGGLTYNNFTVTNASANARPVSISGSNTFANITLTNTQNVIIAGGATQIVSGAFTLSGTQNAIALLAATGGGVGTLSVANATALNWVYLTSITGAGAGSITARSSFDGGVNTSVTIIPPAVVIGG